MRFALFHMGRKQEAHQIARPFEKFRESGIGLDMGLNARVQPGQGSQIGLPMWYSGPQGLRN